MSDSRLAGGFALTLVALVLASGCSGNGPSAPENGSPMRVTLRDFRISAPDRVAPGDYVLSVENEGPEAHELIVVRKDGDELPFRPDGLTVDEEALDTLGAIEPFQPDAVEVLQLHLDPGRYELLCNMSGHYLGGMEHDLVVQ